MINFNKIWVIGILVLILAGCQQGLSEEYIEKIELIESLITNGDYEGALVETEAAINIEPEEPEAYVQKGFIHLTYGEYDEAKVALDEAFKYEDQFGSDELKYKAYYNMGSLLYQLSDYEGALVNFQKAVALSSTDSDLYNAVGLCYGALGDFTKALENYTLALDYDNSNYNAYGNIAYIMLLQKDYERALDEINTALNINPKVPQFYLIKGEITKALDLVDEGILNYTQALNYYDTYADAYYNRGSLYLEKQDYLKAISDFSFAKDYGVSEGYLGMGHCYYGLNQFSESIDAFNQYLDSIEKIDLVALYWIGLSYYQLNEFDQVIQVYQEFLQIEPEDVEVMLVLSYAYMETNQYIEARSYLEKIVVLNPDHVEATKELEFLNEHELGI